MGTIATHDVTVETELVRVTVPDAVIREAGWIREGEEEHYCHEMHCDSGDCECVLVERAVEVVQAWHNQNHSYAFSFCDQRPCSDLRKASSEW